MFELAMHVSTLHYAYTFYPVEVLSIGLALGVIYEVFKVVLEPYDAFRRVWRWFFFVAGIALFTIAVFWVLYGAGPQADRLTQSMNLLQTTLRFIQAGFRSILLARGYWLRWVYSAKLSVQARSRRDGLFSVSIWPENDQEEFGEG